MNYQSNSTAKDGSAWDWGLPLALFALLLSFYLLTFSGVYHASDEMSMLAATDSLARRGAWDIELLRWMGEQQGSFGPDGHLYSRKGIGTTLAALPLYWLALQTARWGNVQAAMLTNGLVTALTGMLVYLVLRRLRYGRGAALGTALAYGLATMAWPYARYLFSESLAGLGLMLSAYFLACYGSSVQSSLNRQDRPWTSLRLRIYPLLAGGGLAIALMARMSNAIVAPFLGLLLLYYLYQRYARDLKKWILPVVLFALPVLVALGIAAWYNWLRFGSPLNTGYLPEERFATPFFEGFYGLTFSFGKGLFWYNPVLLAALVAWPAFFRRDRAVAMLSAAVVLVNIAFYASWYLWWAGHGWGPRFLVMVLPFAALPLAAALEAAARNRALAVALALLAVLSIAVQVLGVTVNFNHYLEDVYAELGLYHPRTLFDPGYSPLARQWSYLRPEYLDLAWARGDSLDWLALLVGLGLVLVAALGLVAAWRREAGAWVSGGLLLLLVLGVGFLLLRYAPSGDAAAVALDLAVMERPNEAAALTEPRLTEPFQDAYDGRLWVWGVPSIEEVGAGQDATWSAGAGAPRPAVARFQKGEVRLDYSAPVGEAFDTARLPAPAMDEAPNLGNVVQLVAFQLNRETVHAGDALEVTLYWRTLSPMDASNTVFIQAADEQGVKAGQLDRLPCHGDCPTTAWQPGDLVGERYNLPIAIDAPPGRYHLIAGMYHLATGQRLPLLDTQGQPANDHILLGTVEVQLQ